MQAEYTFLLLLTLGVVIQFDLAKGKSVDVIQSSPTYSQAEALNVHMWFGSVAHTPALHHENIRFQVLGVP